MTYLPLRKYGYSYPDDLKAELLRRQECPSSIRLPFDQARYFYVVTPRIAALCEEVLLNESQVLPERLSSLPPSTLRWAFNALVVREVHSTHQIEGVHSSRQEIEEAMLLPTAAKRRRFHEFVRMLQLVFGSDSDERITSLQDIRDLYDKITDGEGSGYELDGDLFRRDIVYVYSDAQKKVHTGFQPESRIHEGLAHMLAEAKEPSSTRLIGAILCHFMFETVHPFYDGNGRTGRVLLGYHLRGILERMSILSLSQAISDNKRAYYDALKEARDPRNFGELTHFIITMLEFILAGQRRLADDMLDAAGRIRTLHNNIETLEFHDLSSQEATLMRSILEVIGDHHAFGTDLGVSLDMIVDSLRKRTHKRTVSHACTALRDRGYLVETKMRPRMFTLTPSTATQLGLD